MSARFFSVFSILLLSSAAFAVNLKAPRLFPEFCVGALLDAEFPRLPNFAGLRWTGQRIENGDFGGFKITARLEAIHPDIPHSLEADFAIVYEALGRELAYVFGYEIRGGLAVFPSRAELNGRIEKFNELIGNDKNHPAYLYFQYFKPEAVESAREGRYFLERATLDRRWPLEDNGHLFYHDANFHFALNLIPLEYIRLVEAQSQYILEFIDYLSANHPALANLEVRLHLPREGGKGYGYRMMALKDALPTLLIRDLDFGNGNFLYHLRFATLDSPLDYAEHSRLRDKKRDYSIIYNAVDSLNVFTGQFAPPNRRLHRMLADAAAGPNGSTNLAPMIEKLREFESRNPPPEWTLAADELGLDSRIWKAVRQRYEAIKSVVRQHSGR